MIKERKILQYKSKIVFEKIVMGNFNRIPKVFQETEACFMYVEKGVFNMRTPNNLISFTAKEGMLAKCGNYYFEQKKEDHLKELDTKAIGVYFYPSIVKELFDFEHSLSDFHTDYDITKIKINKLIENYIKSIEFLLDNPSISSNTMILTKLKEFLLLLTKTENAPSVQEFITSLFKPLEYNFKKIINENICANLSQVELAKLCGMSISSFQRKFADTFNQTPFKYILKQKMVKVLIELKNKKKRISDIAYDCGFESTSTFNRHFKKIYAQSPSEYRKNEFGQ